MLHTTPYLREFCVYHNSWIKVLLATDVFYLISVSHQSTIFSSTSAKS